MMDMTELAQLALGATAVVVATSLLVGVGMASVMIARNFRAMIRRSESSLLRDWAKTYIREAAEASEASGRHKHNAVSEKLMRFAQENGVVVKQEDVEAVVRAVYNTIKGNL